MYKTHTHIAKPSSSDNAKSLRLLWLPSHPDKNKGPLIKPVLYRVAGESDHLSVGQGA